MATVFTTILNMSLTASVIILVVLLARLCLKRLPKIYSYLLWSVVLFRLLCPVSFSLPVSVLAPMAEASTTAGTGYTASMEYITVPERPSAGLTAPDGDPAENTAPVVTDVPAAAAPAQEAKRPAGEIVLTVLGWLWAAGVAAVLGFTTLQTIALKRRLDTAFLIRGNIFESEQIDTAFVLGVFKPIIYLPLDLPFNVQKAVIAHEQTHQRRGDHIVKLVSYGALAIHWFNPLVWLSFRLMCDDMEKSCDEAVIRTMNDRGYTELSVKKAYSNMLFALGGGKQHIFSPVSFAEHSTRERILNVANYSKVARKNGIALTAACVIAAAVCAVNPVNAGASNTDDMVSSTDIAADSSVSDTDAPKGAHLSTYIRSQSDIDALAASGELFSLELLIELPDENSGRTTAAKIDQLDFSPLGNLRNLAELSIAAGRDEYAKESDEAAREYQRSVKRILDCLPAERLVSLTLFGSLSIGSENAESLSRFAQLEALKSDLFESTYAFEHLDRLTSLRTLITSGSARVDTASLAALTSLEILYLGDYEETELVDVSGLHTLSALKELYISAGKLTGTEAIASMGELRTFYLLGSPDNLSFLAGLSKLEELELCLTDSTITDFSPLSSLTGLKTLRLDGHISDISPLSSLDGLETLGISGNFFPDCRTKLDLSPLAGKENLKRLTLNLYDADLTPLYSCSALEYLKMHVDSSLMDKYAERVRALKEQLPQCEVFCDNI